MSIPTLTRYSVLQRALPIIAANIAVPLVGIVDLAVIGNTGTTEAIAAVALGALMFTLLYYGFGFLRMGSTALAAQADGAKQPGETAAVFWRGTVLGLGLGTILLALMPVIGPVYLNAFSGTPEIEQQALAYFNARLWGAPASLAGVAIYGWLIGLGLTGRALIMQLVLNLSNIALSVWFVIGLNWSVEGLGFASAVSQWIQLGVGLAIIAPIVSQRRRPSLDQVLNRKRMIRLLAVNRDIFLRTVALLLGFYWFNNASLALGPETLAGNAILLQFISVSAYFLDAFANVTESEVGRAAGAKNWSSLTHAFRLTNELAFVFSVLIAATIIFGGSSFIDWMTDEAPVQDAAKNALIWCALVPLLGWPSYQLDGLMIGVTRGPLMRNAMLAALVIYIALDLMLRPLMGINGLWLAFLLYYVARAATLGVGWPGLKRDFQINTNRV